jgi:hypothetical protein
MASERGRTDGQATDCDRVDLVNRNNAVQAASVADVKPRAAAIRHSEALSLRNYGAPRSHEYHARLLN